MCTRVLYVYVYFESANHFVMRDAIAQLRARGTFHSRRSNTTLGQIDFGSNVHFRMTAE